MKTSLITIATGLCFAASLAPVSPASAGTSGTANGTVTMAAAIRSITVSAANPLPLNNCWTAFSAWSSATPAEPAPGTAMPVPNGFCISGLHENSVTITNGPVPGHIDVQAGNATGNAGGSLTLVTSQPGTGQYALATYGPSGAGAAFNNGQAAVGTQVSSSLTCDTSFAASQCSAAANQVGTEDLGMVGPLTQPADASFTFTTTWTAVP